MRFLLTYETARLTTDFLRTRNRLASVRHSILLFLFLSVHYDCYLRSYVYWTVHHLDS